MKNGNKTSGIIAALKTAAFFGILIAVIGAVFYFNAGAGNAEKLKKDGYKAIDIMTLASFEYVEPQIEEAQDENPAPQNQIPEKIRQLNGQKISVTGFMMPVRVDNEGMVEEFALNGNYDMCFYGAPSQINQWVHVKMQEGAKVRFTHNPTTVAGTLEVGELVQDGEVVSLYRLTGDKASSVSGRLF